MIYEYVWRSKSFIIHEKREWVECFGVFVCCMRLNIQSQRIAVSDTVNCQIYYQMLSHCICCLFHRSVYAECVRFLSERCKYIKTTQKEIERNICAKQITKPRQICECSLRFNGYRLNWKHIYNICHWTWQTGAKWKCVGLPRLMKKEKNPFYRGKHGFSDRKASNPRVLFDLFYCNSFYRFLVSNV